jgi:putative membrane protein
LFCCCLLIKQEQSAPSQPRERPDQNVALREELAGVLEPRELESVMASAHKPNHVVQIMSELMTHCHISGWDKINMDDNITQFHDNIGTCERLFKTPIPVAYTCVTSRFLMLWHLTLPFALWEDCHWLTIPVTFATAAALFYIEEVGVLIEEPFWVLALNSISNGIVAALDGLAAAQKEMMASSLWLGTSAD